MLGFLLRAGTGGYRDPKRRGAGREKDYVDRLTVNALALLLCCLMSSDVS